MKAKRGGNVTESQLKTIFADDKAMQDLLKVDCQKDFLLNTLNKLQKESETNQYGGMPKKQVQRSPERSDDEDFARMSPRAPLAEGIPMQVVGECTGIQKLVAMLLSITIELGSMYIKGKVVSYCFPGSAEAINNILLGLVDVLYQNLNRELVMSLFGAIFGGSYATLTGRVNYEDILQKLQNFLRNTPLIAGAYDRIAGRANKLCDNGFIPIGRGLTLQILRAKLMNILTKKGFGAEAERLARLERNVQLKELELASELARRPGRERVEMLEQELYRKQRQEIPIVPRIGGPSGLDLYRSRKPVISRLATEERGMKLLRPEEKMKKTLKQELKQVQEEVDDLEYEQNKVEQNLTKTMSRLQKAQTEFEREMEKGEKDISRVEGARDDMERFQEQQNELLAKQEELRRMRARKERELLITRETLMAPLEEKRATKRTREQEEERPRYAAAPSPIDEDVDYYLQQQMESEVEPEPEPEKKKKKRTNKGGRKTHKNNNKQSKKLPSGKHHRKTQHKKKHHKKTHKKN